MRLARLLKRIKYTGKCIRRYLRVLPVFRRPEVVVDIGVNTI